MIREANALAQAFLFPLIQRFHNAHLFDLLPSGAFHAVDQIKIHIRHTQALQLDQQLFAHIFFFLDLTWRYFGCNFHFFAVSIAQSKAQRFFTAGIGIRSIAIVNAAVNRMADHSNRFFLINLMRLRILRQAHAAHAQQR